MKQCPICNGVSTWFTPEISKCTSCQSLFRNFGVDYQKEYVDKDYWFDIEAPEWEWVPIEQENQFNYFKNDLTPGITFEAGAANGFISQHLSLMQEKVIMQDLVDIRTDEIKSIKNIEFRKGTFEDVVLTMPDESVNNVVMNNVIEHINDINNTMKETRRILKKGGVFVIITDDGNNPFGSLMAMMGHNEHVICITEHGFNILANTYGFKIIKCWHMTDNLIHVTMEAI